MPEPEPRRSQLRRILDEHPEARPRIKRAVANLLGVGVATIGLTGVLLIWHLRRRRRLILERLGRPRLVRLPEPEDVGPAPGRETDQIDPRDQP